MNKTKVNRLIKLYESHCLCSCGHTHSVGLNEADSYNMGFLVGRCPFDCPCLSFRMVISNLQLIEVINNNV